MTGAGAAKGHAGRANGKSGVVRGMAARDRERPKPHAPACPGLCPRPAGVTLILAPGFRNQTLPPIYLAASALRSSGGQEIKPCRAKRIAVRSRETPGAINGLRVDRARQNNILREIARRAAARARSGWPMQRARKKPKPPKAPRQRRKQRRRKPECSKGRDDGQDRRPRCQTLIRPLCN